MFRRPNPAAVPILLALILVNVACSGFFSLYWLKDTRWATDSNDLGIRWLSDDDYRAIAASTAPEYRLPGGTTLAFSPDPAERAAFLARFDLGTPDGRWHGRASTRLGPPAVQTWLGLALPVSVLGLLGLLAGRPASRKAASAKGPRLEEFVA